MKRLKIIKNAQIVQFCDFSNDEAMNSFIEVLNLGDSGWGKPEHTIVVEDAVYDEDGVLLQEEVTQLVPAEFTIEIEDITEQIQAENIKKQKLEAGKRAREACTRCLDIIAGHNLEQELSAAQITEMQTTFAPIQSALMTSRPSTAKALISQLIPDNILVSQELKDLVLAELSEY